MSKDKETLVKYLDGKVQIKGKPLTGENIPVYVRPGDKIDLELLGLNLETAKFKLVGGDLILEIPGAGEFTFVSLALMGYSSGAPEFIGAAGKIITLSSILSDIDDINALPINSTPTNEYINMLNEIAQENKKEVAPQVIIIDNNPATEQNDNVSNLFDLLEAQKKSLNLVESNDFTSNLTKTDSKKSSKQSSKQEDNVASVEGIEPTLSFDIDIQHVQIRENTTIDTSNLKTLTVHGGGGTSYANIYPKGYNLVDKTALVAQTKTETIDYSDKSGSYDHVVIHADDSALFDITKTSRTIQLTPSQPEGFQITKVTISSADFPEGFSALNGVASGNTWTIQKDNPLTEEIDGFTIDNKGAINFTFSVNNTRESNSVFTIKATSVFDINNVSEANKATIIPPVKTQLQFEKDYAVQVKDIQIETKAKEYDFEPFSINGKEYKNGFVITSNINNTETKGSQELVNTIYGGIVNDTIYGGTKNDTIYGNRGDDTIFSSAGNDIIDGGVGSDTLNYSKIDNVNNIGINADLAIGIVTGDGTDTISNIENIIGTSNYSDILKGNSDKNIISGLGGHDTIYGIGGENTLYGGTGNDTIYTAYTATSKKAIGQRGDVVYGGRGTDTLVGSFNEDFLIGGEEENNADVETDWIDYSNLVLGANTYGISVNLEQTTNFTDTGDRDYLDGNYSQVIRLDSNGNEIVSQFDYISQIENITGSSGDDTFTGNTSQNSILAGAGDDIIYYTRGLDYYDGGNHTTSSGQGSGTPSVGGGDWISLAKETTTTVNFDLYNNNVGANISLATVTNIENVIGYNGTQATTGWGTDSNNTFVMYAGNDSIIGRQGNDVYDLGDGNDAAFASYGNDTIIGGAGIDRLDYTNNYSGTNQANIIILTSQDLNGDGDTADANESITVQSITVQGLATLTDGTYNFFKIRDSRTTFFDYLYQESDGTSDIEQFYLSNNNAYADIFSGDADANTVWAYAGNDTIYGQGGNDLIDGGDSNDSVYGGIGNDTLLGGNADDKLYGEDGDDTLYSDGGVDYIDGGIGTDLLLFGGTGTARVVVNLSTSSITYDTTNSLAANRVLDNGGSTDTVVNLSIENVTGGTGADTFAGSAANNVLNGADGNDYFYASLGADSIIGGNGTDTLDFTNLTTTAGVNVTLNTSLAFSGITQTVSTMENFTGSAQNDTITGDGAANLLIGGAGADTLKGMAGADVIYGGIGDDSIDGGAANDTLYGDAGNDLFTIDFSSVDTIDGGANTLKDTVKFNSGNTGTSISADTDFVMNSTLTNIEKLDITGLTLNTANNYTEFNFTEAMIDAWTGSSTGNLTLSLKSSQVEKIKFTDSSSVVHDTSSTITDNASYTIGNNTLTIDIIDVP